MNRADVADPLRQIPGLNVVQQGQRGGVTSVFIRGGSSTANRVVMDGVPVEDIGGRFDFGNVSTLGLQDVEVYRGPNTVLYGSDAAAGVVALTTPRGSTSFPSFLYEGDAGSFKTYRNQAQLAGMMRKLDYYLGASSLYTQNSVPNDEYHDGTAVSNFGYSLSAKTQVRITARASNSATGLPGGNGGYSFYGWNDGEQSDQDAYGAGAIDHAFRETGMPRCVMASSASARIRRVVPRRQSAHDHRSRAGNYYGKTSP